MEKQTYSHSGGIIVLLLFQILFFLGHVLAHGAKLDWTQIYSYSDSLDTAYLFLMYLLCRVGSIGYLIGLGYFGIKEPSKTLVLFLTSSFFYSLFTKIYFGDFSIGSILVQTISFFHTGPLILAIILYPILSQLKYSRLKKEVIVLLFIATIYYFGVRLVLNMNDHTVDINILYFLLGIILSNYGQKIKGRVRILALISTAFMIMGGYLLPNGLIHFIANYNNILYVMVAMSLCLEASEWFKKKGKLISFIEAEVGLPYIGLYLLTDNLMFIKYGYPSFLSLFLDSCMLGFIYCIAFIVVASIVHRFISIILSKTYDLTIDKFILNKMSA